LTNGLGPVFKMKNTAALGPVHAGKFTWSTGPVLWLHLGSGLIPAKWSGPVFSLTWVGMGDCARPAQTGPVRTLRPPTHTRIRFLAQTHTSVTDVCLEWLRAAPAWDQEAKDKSLIMVDMQCWL
jgi:hypothetical protein